MSSVYSELSHFLTMGHYGVYVWSAYGLAAMIVMLNVIAMRHQHQHVRRRLRQWFKDKSR